MLLATINRAGRSNENIKKLPRGWTTGKALFFFPWDLRTPSLPDVDLSLLAFGACD